MEEKRLKRFWDAGLEVAHIISTYILLTRTQLHGHTELQGSLRNTVQLYNWNKRKWVLVSDQQSLPQGSI